MNREGTHGAKEKLNFSHCDLNDQQVSCSSNFCLLCNFISLQIIALSRVLAENPKISFLDFTENEAVGEPGVFAMNNLVSCQLEASRLLADDDALTRVTFLNEIKWSKKQMQFVSMDIFQVSFLRWYSYRPYDLSLQALEELRFVNAKIMIKNIYRSLGPPVCCVPCYCVEVINFLYPFFSLGHH